MYLKLVILYFAVFCLLSVAANIYFLTDRNRTEFHVIHYFKALKMLIFSYNGLVISK